MVTSRAQDWVDTHPETALLRRCWRNDRKYRPRSAHPDAVDNAALAEWVTRTVLDSPRSMPWLEWPARFVHLTPHCNLADFHPV